MSLLILNPISDFFRVWFAGWLWHCPTKWYP